MSDPTDPRFRKVYEQYRRPILAYCLRRTTREEAYEAANEVFAVAWRRFDSMPAGEQTLPWLYGVARRVISHSRRSAQRRAKLSARAATVRSPRPPDTETVVVQRQEYETVCNAVSRLKADDREMLLLSAWEGLSHAQIAEIMGYSLSAVDKRIVRAKQRLKRQYDALYADTHRPPASTVEGGDGR